MHSPTRELGPCMERAGFLFSHDCPRVADRQCSHCLKAICDEHSHLVDEEMLCTHCASNDEDDDEDEGTEGELPDSWEDEPNPYLYSSYYYRDYGYYGHGSWGHDLVHDPNDFTEADGESLRSESTEGSEHFEGSERFEEDMGGS
jgi:hypothetical protein